MDKNRFLCPLPDTFFNAFSPVSFTVDTGCLSFCRVVMLDKGFQIDKNQVHPEEITDSSIDSIFFPLSGIFPLWISFMGSC